MEFFEKAFNWLAELSSKMPAIDFKTYFIVVVAVIVGIGVIVALTYFGSRARKLIGASKKIEKYLANVDQVDDDNVSDFTAHCFSSKAPQPLRDSWVQYLGVRFGYPSDVVSDGNVYEKVVKKNKDYRSGIYLAIALLVLGFFAFWGFGTLTAVVFLVLVIINRKQSKKCLEVFEDMQEDLDAKVNLQVESNYATDSSPLAELSGMVEEIIARNTAKAVDAEQEYALEQTPIEALIEEKTEEEKSAQIEEESADETLDEEDGTVEQTIDELIASEPQGADEEPVQVEEQADEQTDEVADEEPVEDTDETVEEEPVQDEETEETEEVEEPVIDEQVEEEPVAEESVEEPAEESEPVEDTETEAVEETVEEPEEQESEESPVEESTEEVKEQETESVDEATDDSESTQEEIAEDEDVEPAETEDPVDDVENEDAEETDENEDGEETQAEDEEPEVVYVVDGDEDDDEHVKPAKLVKLPNLVDYMLSKNMPRAMKIQIATMLIGTYKKFENSKEDRKIVVSCLAKVMRDLQENK